MSATVETTFEYAVEVLGVGYVGASQHPPFNAVVGADQPDVFTSEAEAQSLAARIRSDYVRLSLPAIANTVSVVMREVQVSRSDWSTPPVTIPQSAL